MSERKRFEDMAGVEKSSKLLSFCLECIEESAGSCSKETTGDGC